MTADERRLLRLFRALPESRREGLLDYADYLLAKANAGAAAMPDAPLDIPRPAQENVVKAIKRLTATYPMLDRGKLLHDTSALMTQHLVHGRQAGEVIDELEAVFLRHYENHLEARKQPLNESDASETMTADGDDPIAPPSTPAGRADTT